MAKAKKSKSKGQDQEQTTDQDQGQTVDQTPAEKDSHPWLGKTILTGLTWRDQHGKVTDQRQIFGIITRIVEGEHSLEVDQANGEFWTLPFYPETIMQARRGKYVCRSNGREVINPDLVMSWRIVQTEGNEQHGWQPNFLLYSNPVEPPEWIFTPDSNLEYLRNDIFQRGDQFIGKHILIGIQYFETTDDGSEGKFISQEQRHGEIIKANPADGIVVKQADGEEFKMPPDLTMLERAPAAEYKMRSTGEVVVNPDYIAIWAVYRPQKIS